jgi:hypothetical protein
MSSGAKPPLRSPSWSCFLSAPSRRFGIVVLLQVYRYAPSSPTCQRKNSFPTAEMCSRTHMDGLSSAYPDDEGWPRGLVAVFPAVNLSRLSQQLCSQAPCRSRLCLLPPLDLSRLSIPPFPWRMEISCPHASSASRGQPSEDGLPLRVQLALRGPSLCCSIVRLGLTVHCIPTRTLQLGTPVSLRTKLDANEPLSDGGWRCLVLTHRSNHAMWLKKAFVLSARFSRSDSLFHALARACPSLVFAASTFQSEMSTLSQVECFQQKNKVAKVLCCDKVASRGWCEEGVGAAWKSERLCAFLLYLTLRHNHGARLLLMRG